MNIRNAEMTDLPKIMGIYAYARQYMTEHGNPNQWATSNWPPEELIREDIRVQKCRVCVEDDEVLGVLFYDYGEKVEPVYNEIEGAWIGCDEYGVVHRIASSGTRKGVGAYCLNWAFEQCGDLRIDTHDDNQTMQNLLLKLGFQKCGIVYLEDGDTRVAFEKIRAAE